MITCIIQRWGDRGVTRILTLQKDTPLSQIPGLVYRKEALSMVPKPPTWDMSKLSLATVQSIRLTVVDEEIVDPQKLETVD